jgi:hypothetical protein
MMLAARVASSVDHAGAAASIGPLLGQQEVRTHMYGDKPGHTRIPATLALAHQPPVGRANA